ncbi:MAG TPA: M48 family metalloprotease [Burkholderiales bacterium]|nr:M48 family metalloprotease [Burkholderiales bacterium]
MITFGYNIGMKAFLAALLLLLSSCAQNPVTGGHDFVMLSAEQEIKAGQEADPQIRQQFGVYEDAELQKYANEIGQMLAKASHRPDLDWHFTVLDSPDINAFALPGGYIYITRGILAYLNSEAELAAVLGHEIGHVTARHSVQQMSKAQAAGIAAVLGSILVPELRSAAGQQAINAIGGALLAGYGREDELEADRLGAQYLARNGYEPQAMVRVVSALKDQELFDAEIAKQEGREPRRYHGLFATHPDNDTRLKEVVAEAGKVAATGREENRAAYFEHIDDVIFGDSAAQGIVRDGGFYHADLGLALKFPKGWRIRNTPAKVQAQNAKGDVVMELLAVAPQATPEQSLKKAIRAGFGTEVRSISINGLPAAITTTAASGRPARVAAIHLGDKAFLFGAIAANGSAMKGIASDVDESINSFHAITAEERKLAEPRTLQTITAKTGTRFSELARASVLDKHAEAQLRLINAFYPEGEPAPGQKLKVVQ